MPSARSTISGSSSAQPRCCVNGCQRWSRSSRGEAVVRLVSRGATLAIVPVGMPPLPLLVFVVGTGSLGAEIAAVRLLSPVLRRLHDRVGEHDRRRARGAVDRLLAGRPLRRPPPAHARALPAGPRGRRPARARAVRRPTRCSTSAVEALDSISAGAFVGSLVGVLGLVAVPVLLLGAVSPWALRLAVQSVEKAGRSPAASTRSRRRAAWWARCSPRSCSSRWWARGARS